MAQSDDTKFLTSSNPKDFLVKKGESVLDKYYAEQKAKAQPVKYVAPKRPTFQNNGMVRAQQPQTFNVTQPFAPRQPMPVAPASQQVSFNDWYRMTKPGQTNFAAQYKQAGKPVTWNMQQPYTGHGYTSLNPKAAPFAGGQNRAMQMLETIGNTNPLYSLPAPTTVPTNSLIYAGGKVPYGMQRAVEIEAGRANQDMLLYNHVYDQMPPPPTVDTGTGTGSGGGGYYAGGGYPYYSSGGGGGGYGGYDSAVRWWLDPTVWRI